MSENEMYSILPEAKPEGKTLWGKFIDGDLDAWEQIFQRYYSDLYGYGLKLTSRRELTKDAIHQLFVQLWDRRNYLSEVESVKAYLLASLRRSLLKKLNKRRKYYEDIENTGNEIPKSSFLQR
ncbi:MAG: sigma factor [Balneolaceae bacterium]|nr:sigma factor [Balneolaceae bacterium]